MQEFGGFRQTQIDDICQSSVGCAISPSCVTRYCKQYCNDQMKTDSDTDSLLYRFQAKGPYKRTQYKTHKQIQSIKIQQSTTKH